MIASRITVLSVKIADLKDTLSHYQNYDTEFARAKCREIEEKILCHQRNIDKLCQMVRMLR